MPAQILVIEDDQVTQDLMAHLLRLRGHRVATATDGTAALESAAVVPPDLILCDINLPTTNGLEVLQRLRQTPLAKTTPVIAVTASGSRDADGEARVGDRMTGLGFTAYIPKPIDPKTFALKIEGYLPEALRGPAK